MAFTFIRTETISTREFELMITNNPTQVKETVRKFINSSINIDGVGDDDDLFESGIVNSLFAVQLMTFVERGFEIEIGMEDLDVENFKSVSATAAFIHRKSAGKAARSEEKTPCMPS